MEENDVMLAAEPAAALLSEEVRRSGILSQVMKLSQPDKVALIAYLKRGMETEEPFKTDEFGRIKLTKEMRDAAMKAERDYEDGKCLTEADFKERFAKWLEKSAIVPSSLIICKGFSISLMNAMEVTASVRNC